MFSRLLRRKEPEHTAVVVEPEFKEGISTWVNTTRMLPEKTSETIVKEKEPKLIEDIHIVPKPKENITVVSVALLDSEYVQLIESLNNDFFEQSSPGRRRILAILEKIEKSGGKI